MVETTTLHYGWTKPEISHSPSTWGGFLNTDLDSIDALVFANQQGIVPIGAIQMFAGATAPANWLLCQGQALSTTGTYAALFAVCGYAYGGSGASFNLPNLQQRFPYGAGTNAPGVVGGNFNCTIAVANLPAHNHPATDGGHQHYINLAQTPHAHSDAGHGHTATEANHFHGGVFQPGAGSWYFGASGLQSVNQSGNTASGAGGVTVNTGTANINPINANVSVAAQNGTGGSYSNLGNASVTIGNTGSGTPLSVVPPFIAINFIIRYQ